MMSLDRFRKNYIALAGAIIILFYVLVALLSLVWLPQDPLAMNSAEILKGPSFATGHLMGTDEFGRDIFSRVIVGSRISEIIAVGATGLGGAIGIFMGIWAGYLGGRWDNVIMRVTDVLFSFPTLLLALFIMAVLGEKTFNIVVAIGIVYIPQFARLSRASILAIRSSDYVRAARSIGGSRSYILFRHLLPNILVPIIVQISLSLSVAVLLESALSFLGLGVQPPAPSWGNMLSAARKYMTFAPWTAVFPGLAIVVLVLGFNLLGDGLRDLLDPRLKNVA
ncbi:MAG TPA: ABC transporter permease [Spirochaetia bacterium]|nr:ABC transporter permease [Spirochaetia bacterium]